MLTWIAFAEAIGATVAACVAILSRDEWKARAKVYWAISENGKLMGDLLQRRNRELDAECKRLVSNINTLSAEVDRLRSAKPSHTKRAAERELILTTAMRLNAEVAAR